MTKVIQKLEAQLQSNETQINRVQKNVEDCLADISNWQDELTMYYSENRQLKDAITILKEKSI